MILGYISELLIRGDSVLYDENEGSSVGSFYSHRVVPSIPDEEEEEPESGFEEEPLVQTVECRICQEEDTTKKLEIP